MTNPLRTKAGRTMIGLLAIPASVLPFLLYATMTAEGQLLADKVRVAIDPPDLPTLSAAEVEEIRAVAPDYSGSAAVLVYHGLGSSVEGEDASTLDASDFGRHLAALSAAGFNAVTVADLAAAMEGGPPLPDRAVVISFDDGRTDSILWADPLLDQAGMAATMFVITDRADSPGIHYAGWGRLEDMAESGRWDLQSHTANHHHRERVDGREIPALTVRYRGESLAQVRSRIATDLDASIQVIVDHTGVTPVAFAYPFGAWGGDDRTNDPDIAEVLRDEITERFTLAFHQDDQDDVPLGGCGEDPAGMRRLDVEAWTGLELVERIAQMVDDTPEGCRR